MLSLRSRIGPARATCAALYPLLSSPHHPLISTTPSPPLLAPPAPHRSVTVLFADVCGFTEFAQRVAPHETFGMLNRLFYSFDDILKDYPNIYKVCVGGGCAWVCVRVGGCGWVGVGVGDCVYICVCARTCSSP